MFLVVILTSGGTCGYGISSVAPYSEDVVEGILSL